VCSSTGDAIDRIVAAIDQLAADARGAQAEADERVLTARVAALWQLLGELDPDLARRTRRYTAAADGGPSA
jgi:transposase InsO family protein